MIFMSQSGITDPQHQAEWDAWYLSHLELMLTVNGIQSAQRFKLIDGDNSPSLAIYTIVSPDVFQDDYYLSIRGMGEWLPLIDRRYYRRNLFTGLEVAPDVHDMELLLVADRRQPDPELMGTEWTWLEAVALDRSPPYRALAVASQTEGGHIRGRDVARYRPVTGQLIPSKINC